VGSRAVGVIFSGGDGDGTEGCQYIDAVLSSVELSTELVRIAASATSSRVLGWRPSRSAD